MSKYTEALKEMQFGAFLRNKKADIVWLTMESIQTTRKALQIADRLEQADVNKAISDYLKDGTLKPVEIVHFANGYIAALADIRGDAE